MDNKVVDMDVDCYKELILSLSVNIVEGKMNVKMCCSAGYITYHLHTEGAVVDGLILNVDVHKGTGFPTEVAGAKSGRQESLVTHGCR